MSRPSYWPDERVKTLYYKAPKSLAKRIDKKVRELRKRGVSPRLANKSSLQRLIIEAEIDHVERFFAAELKKRPRHTD